MKKYLKLSLEILLLILVACFFLYSLINTKKGNIEIKQTNTNSLTSPVEIDLGDSYYKKDNVILFRDYYSGKEYPLGSVDVDSFTTFKYGYAKDKNYVYGMGEIISGADIKSFHYVGLCQCVEKSCASFFQDSNKVYIENNPADNMDSATFQYFGIFSSPDEMMPTSNAISKDKNGIYYACGKSIKNVDLKSFQVLKYGFFEDKNNVYRTGYEYGGLISIKGADPKTFIALSGEYSKDAKNVYYIDQIITGADVNSFNVDKDGNATDKNGSYNSGKLI